ncbi:MAG: hypothetical protein NTV00_06650 [Methylococcales bacterium]|nr:hypothetical protein [Methylococcales bacterium]
MKLMQDYRHSPVIVLLGILQFFGLHNSVLADESASLTCQPEVHRLSEYNVRKAPKKVLLVPLLYRNPDNPRENEQWPEPTARSLNDFYRGQFKTQVHWMRNVRSWQDYYQQTDALIQQGEHFDRVIFIAHGGFDGPILRNEIISETRVIDGDKATVMQVSEAQPGNEHVVSITNSVSKNPAFNAYVTNNWQEILTLPETEVRARLKQQHQLMQPMDMACYTKFCDAKKLSGLTPDTHKLRLDTCERVCRPSLYEVKYYEQASEQRFGLFVNSLKKLVHEDGLIFMGECNAGTPAPKQYSHWDTPGIVVSSKLAGGPYLNYVNLISSATGRLVAGPIGSSSAADVIKRIMALENNHEQRFLCMAQPSVSAAQIDFLNKY